MGEPQRQGSARSGESRGRGRYEQAPIRLEAASSAGRVPPHDLDAEGAVLAAVLLDREALSRVSDILTMESFYSDANGKIFEAAIELAKVGTPIDILNVATYLRDREKLAGIGGASYLAQLADATPAVAHVVSHAETVREKARLRHLIAVCQKVSAEGYGDVGVTQEFIDSAHITIATLAKDQSVKGAPKRLGTGLLDGITRDMKRIETSGSLIEIRTGWDRLDEKIAGLHRGDLMIVAARPGMGKALTVDAKVLTPSGWCRNGDLAVGDLVIGANGRACAVTGVYDQGELDVFRVTMDDGGSTVCCDEHLWLTRTRSDRRAKRAGSVKPLREIRASVQRAGSDGANHSIPFVEPVRFDLDGSLPIDPWLLGVYLGDGCSPSGSLRIDKPERDVLRRVELALPHGDGVTVAADGTGLLVRKAQRTNGRSATLLSLEALGLRGLKSGEKFIPPAYLRATIAERLELLRGLCDTDGYVTMPGRKSVEYSTSSPRLRDDIAYLVGSLGGCSSWVAKQGAYTKDGVRHETLMSYRMVLCFPRGGITPVSSEKQLKKWNPEPVRIGERFIRSVEPAGRALCRCIAVDAPDHLYVTDDFIVTHNTSAALLLALNVVAPDETEAKVLPREADLCAAIFSLEMPLAQVQDRFVCMQGGLDVGARRRGSFDHNQWTEAWRAGLWLVDKPVWVDDTPGISPAMIRTKLRHIVAEWERVGPANKRPKKLGVVVVDYLQLMRFPGFTGEQEVSEISKALKEIAKEFDVPVVALSQLNRAVETRDAKNKRPTLSDLRGSGSIEQDADTIIFLFRPEYYDPNTSAKGIAEFIVAKQRNGALGKVLLRWTGSCTRFDNLRPGEGGDDEDHDQ